VAKNKPDARPNRVIFGFAGLATASALATVIVVPPQPPANQPDNLAGLLATDPPLSPDGSVSPRPVTYVRLEPGQSAPPGALVVDISSLSSGASLEAPVETPGPAGAAKPAPKQASGGSGGQHTSTQPPAQSKPTPAPTPKATPKPKPKPTPIATTQSGKPK
jgi:hypothetical protein